MQLAGDASALFFSCQFEPELHRRHAVSMFNKAAMSRKYSRRSEALGMKGKSAQECQRNTDTVHNLVPGTDKGFVSHHGP